MYAIVTVIYGIPLNTNDSDEEILWSEELETFIEANEDKGFFLPYSGSGDVSPSAFGVGLDGFDEACHHVEISDLKLKPSAAQLKKYARLWEALPDFVRSEITIKYGTPRTFLLWSTS